MCVKFTAMFSWREVVSFSQPLAASADDRLVTFRVMANVPVIMFDREAGVRRVVPMRWGFPKPGNWKIPQPIHARSETVDTKQPFKKPFAAGQRGIVVVKTFNEAPDIEGPTQQHTITLGGIDALGIAFVWDRFEIPDLPAPVLAAVMVTVPANKLIATLPTDRMPAALEVGDWAAWLGEDDATPDQAKAVLRTMEGVDWLMEAEPKPTKPKKPA
jgi:putative SOS response-associated peptidase YedK